MSSLPLFRSQIVSIQGQFAEFVALLPDGDSLQFRLLHDGSLKNLRGEEALTLYTEGQIDLQPTTVDAKKESIAQRQMRYLEDYSENEKEAGLRKRKYAQAALMLAGRRIRERDLKDAIRRVAQEIGDESPPSPESVRDWTNLYRIARQDARALIPLYRRRGNRKPRGYIVRDGMRFAVPAEESEALLQQGLIEYLRREKPKKHGIFKHIDGLFTLENAKRPPHQRLVVPSRATIFRRFKKLDPYTVAYYRDGKAKADQMFKLKGDGPGASFPLERVEMDATRLNIHVIDTRSGLVLGRPWITVAMDYYSRAILGFYISFEPPSALTVMRCLRHAIAPKPSYVDILGHEALTWPMHGLPLLLVVDNAKEYFSKSLIDALLQLGVDIQPHPVNQPNWKGMIERGLQTLNEGALDLLPGKTFSNPQEKGDYDAQSEAIVNLSTLIDHITCWIILEYNTVKHEGIGDVPARLWEEGVKKFPVGLPPRIEELDVLLAYTVQRSLTNKGIEWQNLFYRSEALHEMYLRADKPDLVKVKIDEDDLSTIRVQDWRSGQYLSVPVQAKEAEYAAGLTLHEHRAIQAHRRRIAWEYERRPEFLEARALFRKRVMGLIGKKSVRLLEKGRVARLNASKLAGSSELRGIVDFDESRRDIVDQLSPEDDAVSATADDSWSVGDPAEERVAAPEVRKPRNRNSGRPAGSKAGAEDSDGYDAFVKTGRVTSRKRRSPQD